MTESHQPVTPPSPRSRQRLGPYSRRGAAALIDGRSKEALFLKNRRAELVAHLGGNPSATQAGMIERACWLSLRIAQLDAKIAEGGEGMTEHDSKTYLAWSGTLTRLLKSLGTKGVPAPRKTLAEAMAEAARERAAKGSTL
jgi:hypothetical protein